MKTKETISNSKRKIVKTAKANNDRYKRNEQKLTKKEKIFFILRKRKIFSRFLSEYFPSLK